MNLNKKLLVVALASALAQSAHAATFTWGCDGETFWDFDDCWNPVGTPTSADIVNVGSAYYGGHRGSPVVVIDSITGSALASYLNIDNIGSAQLSISLTYDSLLQVTNHETIGINGVGSFYQNGGTNSVGRGLYLGNNTNGIGSYNLAGGTLAAGWEHIGLAGTGNFTQSAGTHTVGVDLNLGYYAGSSGSYTLKGTGNLTAAYVNIGVSGIGNFSQSGGIHTVNNSLTLGNDMGGIGSYTLSSGTLNVGSVVNGGGTGFLHLDGGTLNLTGSSINVDNFKIGNATGSIGSFALATGKNLTVAYESIGVNGSGSLIQNGGIHTVNNDLILGNGSGSSGGYTLSGGNLAAADEYIGGSGSGNFTQNGGIHTVSNSLYLGLNSGSSGSYTLSGGTLNVGSTVNGVAVGGIVNGAGTGTLNLDGGTLNLIGNSINVDNFNVGNATGSIGTFTLASGKSLTATNEVIGVSGTGSFIQSGGTHTASNSLYLGSNSGGSGSYTLSGGTLTVGRVVNSMAVGGIVNGGGTGTFNLDGGALNLIGNSINVDNFNIGNATGSIGSFTLASGKSLTAAYEIIGMNGTGSFIQNGGINTVNSNLLLGFYSGSGGGSGSYTLNDGSLTAAGEYIGVVGIGSFIQNSGTHTVSNVLYLGTYSGSTGSFTLSGGTLTVGSIVNGAAVGGIVNGEGNGTFTLDGGTLNLTGSSIDVDNFNVGSTANSNGNFTLGSGKSLTTTHQIIGQRGSGIFSQSGGTNAVLGNFNVGANSGGSGTYTLSGTGSLSAGNEYIGPHGTGNFNQSGGTNTVSNSLYLGYASDGSGTYTLNGGTLTVTNVLAVGGSDASGGGTGTLTVNAGGYASAGSVKVWNAGSSLTTGNPINVGGGQIMANSLSIADGGHVTSRGAYVGIGNAAISNTVTVTTNADISGADSLWQTRFLSIGRGASGVVNVGDGGRVATTNNLIVGETSAGELNVNADGTVDTGLNAYVGRTSGVVGIVAVGGDGATWNVGDSLYLGGDNLGPGGSGSLTVDVNGVVNVANTLKTWAGGRATVNGVLNATSVSSLGVLDGAGTINANLLNVDGGIVEPGNSPGLLRVTGNYTQGANSGLSIEIGGLVAGATGYDVLDISGTASLDGTLNVSLFDLGSGLFAPQAGDSFDILTADVLQGSFSTLNYATLSSGLTWNIVYLTDAYGTTDVVRLDVQAVPEAETYLMMLAGLGLVGAMARRRQRAQV